MRNKDIERKKERKKEIRRKKRETEKDETKREVGGVPKENRKPLKVKVEAGRSISEDEPLDGQRKNMKGERKIERKTKKERKKETEIRPKKRETEKDERKRRRAHKPDSRTPPHFSYISLLTSLTTLSSMSSSLSWSELGGERSCLIRVLFACSLVSLAVTCFDVSFDYFLAITPLHPKIRTKRGGRFERARERGGGGEGRQVREGFECERQTARRKGRKENQLFSCRGAFWVFVSGYVLVALFFQFKFSSIS